VLQSITIIPESVVLAASQTSTYLPALSRTALTVLGRLADGTQHVITASTRTSYAITNSLVATMDSSGNIIAAAPGVAQIMVVARGNGIQTPLSAQVPVTVNIFELRGDLDGDSDVDTDDIAVVTAALGRSSTGPGDPRDLNGNGMIGSIDVSALRRLCSRSNCATQ
jgi:hypothetical protein